MTLSVTDFIAVHDALGEMSHALLDWHLFLTDKAPEASGHLLRASSHVYDAAMALQACAVDVLPVAVEEEKEG